MEVSVKRKKFECTHPLRFSWHARSLSLPSRSILTPGQVIEILNRQLVVPLGIEHGKLHHELFYSIPDEDWFVAVINRKINEIVTILTLEYHRRWEISDDAKEMAREIAISGKANVPDFTITA